MVGVKARRAAADPCRRLVEGNHRRGLERLAVFVVCHRNRGAVELDLRVVQELGPAAEHLGEHIRVLVEDLTPLRKRLAPGSHQHPLQHLEPLGRVLEFRNGRPFGVVEHPVHFEVLE